MHESEKWKWSRSVVSDSSWPHGLQPTKLLCPWDFPGKSTGVGCHCLLRDIDINRHKHIDTYIYIYRHKYIDIYPKCIGIYINMCIYIFTYNTYTGILAIKRMKYYNAICSNLEIILSKISQRKTNIISLTCEIFKKMIQINLFIKQKKNHRHRKKT